MDTIFLFFCFYLDDILFFSNNRQEHLHHLEHVLTALADNGLRINPDKCTFAVLEVDCLGHHLTPTSLSPLSSQVLPILSFPQPADVKVLQRFLGMLNFYRRFLPGLSCIIQPRTDVCKGTGNICWYANLETSFQAAKVALVPAVPLYHPHPSAILPLPQMLLTPMLVLFSSKRLVATGNPLLSFLISFLLPRPVTPSLRENSWLPISLSAISIFSLKVIVSHLSPITNL